MLPFEGKTTYRDLFDMAFNKYLSFDDLSLLESEDNTIIFELISPANRIVVSYPETDLRLLGIRNNKTGKEINPRDTHLGKVFKTPKIYDIDTINQALEVAKTLGVNEEGFVLVDENFNRVKVKGAEYLIAHKMRSNDFSPKNFLTAVLNNTQDDLVAYFPEYLPYVRDIENRLNRLIWEVNLEIAQAPFDLGRKDFALAIRDMKYAGILFKLHSNQDYNWKDSLISLDNINQLMKLLGLKGGN